MDVSSGVLPKCFATGCNHMPSLAQDLTYTVKSHHNKKVEVSLLSSISGYFSAGQMSALVSAFMGVGDAVLINHAACTTEPSGRSNDTGTDTQHWPLPSSSLAQSLARP